MLDISSHLVVMKLWQCDWVPSSVADWLCRELDEKGIPGTTYTHTLLSLLHPYFCPHPVPKEPSHHLQGSINFEGIGSASSSRHTQELDALFEESQDHVHPDADFPELNVSGTLKEGSCRSNKRLKRKLQKLSLYPEKLWKVVALQCLLTASDEHHSLESIVEELFLRLKTNNSDTERPNSADLLVPAEKEISKTYTNVTSIEAPLTDSSNFPPLPAQNYENQNAVEGIAKGILNWKGLPKGKRLPSPEASSNQTTCPLNQSLDDSVDGLRHVIEKKTTLTSELKGKAMEMCLKDESLENRAYCFIPIRSDQTEGHVTRDQQMECTNKSNKNGGGMFHIVKPSIVRENVDHPEAKEKMEEWECTGDLLPGSVNRAVSVDLLGNRLYERFGGVADTRCSSNSDGTNLLNLNENSDVEKNIPSASIWDYSTSSKDPPDIEIGWNPLGPISQSYDSLNLRPLNHMAPFHQRSIQENPDYPHDERLKSLPPEHVPPSECWPPTRNWYSLASFDSKQAIFSSPFSPSPLIFESERTRDDCKMIFPEENHKAPKNIWSDLNDNITAIQNNKVDCMKVETVEKSPNFNQYGLLQKSNEEELCESLHQLRFVEHLWRNPLAIEDLSNRSLRNQDLMCESSIPFLNDDSKNVTGPILTSEDLHRMKYGQVKEIEDKFFMAKIPSGPSGPYIELRHTETSKFRAVVPNEKNLEDVGDRKGPHPVTPVSIFEGSFTLGPSTQEDENLLTSPRTHFRPIRQDSHGSIDESKSEDELTALGIMSGIQDSELVFQRSGSGTLYLESDLLKGSPKKYMAYREPVTTATAPPLHSGDVHESASFSRASESPSNLFVPKFKLVNNEKFCQTEGPEGSFIIGGTISKELDSKILQNEMEKYDFLYSSSDPSTIKQIWEESPKVADKEAWEIQPGGKTTTVPALNYPKWSIQDLTPVNWGGNTMPLNEPVHNRLPLSSALMQFEESNLLSNSEGDAFNKIKFIWHNSKCKMDSPSRTENKPNPVSFDADFQSSDSWEEPCNRDAEVDPLVSSMVVPKSPWEVSGRGLGKMEEEYESLERERIDLASRWQLQWEVDQEADEILGGLLPPSPLKASPSYENVLRESGGSGIVPTSSSSRVNVDDSLKFLDFMDGQDEPECDSKQPFIEDLEPGWDLNEGFEWGPAAEELFDEGDEERGQEVLVYENADGQTVVLPVEYFEDSLYDQIFGSTDIPIGGSLPDLPAGHINDLKKSGLSYKLSRRSRGEKFIPSSRRPCSFFLEGNCRKNDCKFSHDLLTITCRFWEEGSCLKGDTCPFRHGFVAPSRRRNRSEGDQTSLVEPVSFASLKEGSSGSGAGGGIRGKAIPRRSKGASLTSVNSFELDSETDFPCLGSSVESKIGSLDEQHFPSNSNIKVSKKKKKYITFAKSLLKKADGGGFEGGHARLGGRKKGLRLSLSDLGVDDVTHPRKNGKDCESLRKILRKRYPILPQPPFSHEDGTVSDF